MGLGFTISFLSSETCRLRRAGYIIRKRHMPMGTEIPPICQASMARLRPGKNWDRASPTTMQIPTQIARYLSKTPRALPPSVLSTILNLKLSDVMSKIVYRKDHHLKGTRARGHQIFGIDICLNTRAQVHYTFFFRMLGINSGRDINNSVDFIR